MRPSIRARLRRAATVPVLVLTLLLGTVSGATAVETALAADQIVLATEAGPVGGLDPKGPNDEDNAFAPEETEANFLWGASVGLTALMLGGFAFLGLLYWAMVLRPSRAESSKH